MNTPLEQLMNEATSIIDLEHRLKETGKEFSSYRQYAQWLSNTWHKSFSQRINGILDRDFSVPAFPTTTVESEGIEYLLHGVVHGAPAIIMPGWSMRKNVQRYINATIKSFHKPNEGEEYLYEDGFQNLFDVLQSRKVDDEAASSRQQPIPGFDSIGQFLITIPLATLGMFVFPLFYGAAYLFAKTIRNPQKPTTTLFCLAQKALTDERYQSIFENVYNVLRLPEPFGLEQRYLFDKSSTGLRLSHYMVGLPNLPARGERSLRAAIELRQHASDRQLQKLHYICGTGHVSEIAYFLQHPSYNFEYLDEYRHTRK